MTITTSFLSSLSSCLLPLFSRMTKMSISMFASCLASVLSTNCTFIVSFFTMVMCKQTVLLLKDGLTVAFSSKFHRICINWSVFLWLLNKQCMCSRRPCLMRWLQLSLVYETPSIKSTRYGARCLFRSCTASANPSRIKGMSPFSNINLDQHKKGKVCQLLVCDQVRYCMLYSQIHLLWISDIIGKHKDRFPSIPIDQIMIKT